ncbi:hypothetical protein B5X24_HaOG205315 [Helicoverpa armigera]|uniref:Uncharacterized protein n=1 Tax=Helicoverpa armigera TaxID=29058 RepID=A0A2W1BLG3_HELAM|nr:hypothetical protein B5X24_HaOG205315 [Helicoverpa armigera]
MVDDPPKRPGFAKWRQVLCETETFCCSVRNRLRTNLKEKAFKHAGIPVRKVSRTDTSSQPAPHVAPAPLRDLFGQTVLRLDAEVTLNMLNASEAEEADGLSTEIKLEFDSAYDEAAI